MKKRKGFTLVELLAVIAILAILVIIALPNVLKLFRTAKQNTFTDEVQNLVRSAENKYLTSSMNGDSNNTCFDSKTNKLDMTGRDNLIYKIRLSEAGKIIEVNVRDDDYELIANEGNGINRADIGSKYKVESAKTSITDCEGNSIVEGVEDENPKQDEYFYGSGTQDDPYKIQYIEDLMELSRRVNGGESFENKVFKLMNNLDFNKEDNYSNAENNKDTVTTGIGFTPIGNETNPFSGTFDGNNLEISNLMINENEEDINVGFFGYTLNATIQNLKISGNVTSNNGNVGGIINTSTNTTLNNVTNNINITSNVNSLNEGGLIGEANGTTNIISSKNIAKIISNCTDKNVNVGGLVGQNNSDLVIEKSSNTGNISNDAQNYTIDVLFIRLGGLVGYNTNSSLIIKDSYNTGSIDRGTHVGGLIGFNENSSLIIDNCYNEGYLTSNFTNCTYNFIGGLVAVHRGKIFILNSYNSSNIFNNSNKEIYISGLLGLSQLSENYIINSYNTGNLENTIATYGYVIGLMNSNVGGSILHFDNVYNIGEVKGNRAKFGIFATNATDPSQYTVKNAYYDNSNSIEGSNMKDVCTPKSKNEMKQEEFVTLLNNNRSSIDLNTIEDEFFKNYLNKYEVSLNEWKLGSDYPVFKKD